MKKIILLLCFMPFISQAQIEYPTGLTYDSTTFNFSLGDSLSHYLPAYSPYEDSGEIIIDTTATLWQIGNTIKPVFSNDTIAQRGIMTDTIGTYPANANDFFVLKINNIPNFIIDFWHKYQTDSLHAGGIVEMSTDSGTTWMNVADCGSIFKQNFYSSSDTIVSGQPAFTGTSNGEQLSRFQILNCLGEKTTETSCAPFYFDFNFIYFRFRFVSDTTLDSLSGWMIDSIKIENPGCIPGAVPLVNKDNGFKIFPNPANEEITVSAADLINKITISDLLGRSVYDREYNDKETQVDISGLPSGIYFIKINDTFISKLIRQ